MTRHSERCRECKQRVRELLEARFGACVPNHGLGWPARLSGYEGTALHTPLWTIANALKAHRGFASSDFVRAEKLAPVDFWVPDPGFIVEFDESQHFTIPRKMTLAAYPIRSPLGFSRDRWIKLCEQRKAKDNDPPFRDEQRAWYDALRDLVPSLHGLLPTVRLYAGDLAWCALDPKSERDQQRFLEVAGLREAAHGRRAVKRDASAGRTPSVLRAALVFPETYRKASAGVPPTEAGAQRARVPTAMDFAGEAVDFVLFPEAFIRSSDAAGRASLAELAAALDAPLLVGAVDLDMGADGRAAQVLLRFDPDGGQSCVYVKHSTAEVVAFEREDWTPEVMLPTFELGGVTVGATICHDHYLGLLPSFLASRGARVWVNPSFDNVSEIKWSSVLRLRAVENRFFALCTLHDDVGRHRTHPFGFAPDGRELRARRAGDSVVRPLSECGIANCILLVDLDLDAADGAPDWEQVPLPQKPKRSRSGVARQPVRVAMNGGRPSVRGRSGWRPVEDGRTVETEHGRVHVGVLHKDRILDGAACFRTLDRARELGCAPIIWNHWDRLPADSARLATLMMGRAIECCAPVVVSDRRRVQEVVELSNRNKIPARRTIENSGEGIVDIAYAWGLDGAFRMVSRNLGRGLRRRALDRYRRLGSHA